MGFTFTKSHGTLALGLAAACALSFLFDRYGPRDGPGASTVLLRLGSGGVGGKRSIGNGSDANTNSTRRPDNSSVASDDFMGLDPIDYSSIDGSIPGCARDVFLALRGDDGSECRGMLLRDDLILTSRRCSQLEFTFDFPDESVGELRAFPHTSLNDESQRGSSSIDPRLGFLEANPPYHYRIVDVPVRRSRMFLSGRPSEKIARCKNSRPIAHNFPISNKELAPLRNLLGSIPDDILWEHTDFESAPALNDGRHRWFSRAITRHQAEEGMNATLRAYGGVPGGVSVPGSHEGFISQSGGLCEAVDPRGHRLQYCFKNYLWRYFYARKFSGMHFFDWLDFGHGKFLLERNDTDAVVVPISSDRRCVKDLFQTSGVYFFNKTETSEHEVYFAPSEDGTALIGRYRRTNELVPPTSSAENAPFHMWDLNEKWYVMDPTNWNRTENGFLKHTSLLAGRPALSAGHLFFGEGGKLVAINWMSGHYKPTVHAPSLVYSWMKRQGGFNMTSLYWIGRESWEDCNVHDWEGGGVPGYDPVALERSCEEVRANPMWRLAKDDFSMFDELYEILGFAPPEGEGE